MGLLAIGRRAFGFSSGLAVKVGKELPGPQRIKAWRPGVAIVTAWGILKTSIYENEELLVDVELFCSQQGGTGNYGVGYLGRRRNNGAV